jgi:hypothetical protein
MKEFTIKIEKCKTVEKMTEMLSIYAIEICTFSWTAI